MTRAMEKYLVDTNVLIEHLRGKKKAISGTEKAKLIKGQETQILIQFIEENRLWYNNIDESKYIGEGAEQKIYEFSDTNFILKLNDSIFYALWED